jgi:hypothetical protein
MPRLALSVTAAAVLAAPASAGAFHHRFVPADRCGQSPNAGGANPTAVAAIRDRNPAQGAQGDGLPIPPAGTASNAAAAPACPA